MWQNHPSGEPHLDVVSVAVVLLATLLGNEMAQYVGPYLVIVAGALVGSALALRRRPPSSTWVAVGFAAWLTSITVLFTVPVAYGLSRVIDENYRWFLAPAAVLLAGIGHDWPKAIPWTLNFLRGLVAQRTGVADRTGASE